MVQSPNPRRLVIFGGIIKTSQRPTVTSQNQNWCIPNPKLFWLLTVLVLGSNSYGFVMSQLWARGEKCDHILIGHRGNPSIHYVTSVGTKVTTQTPQNVHYTKFINLVKYLLCLLQPVKRPMMALVYFVLPLKKNLRPWDGHGILLDCLTIVLQI